MHTIKKYTYENIQYIIYGHYTVFENLTKEATHLPILISLDLDVDL